MISEYDNIIKRYATKHLPVEIEWRLFKAQLFKESGLNPNAVSPVGALGIPQFMPATWEDMVRKYHFDSDGITDPEQSIQASAIYMRELWQQWTSPRPWMDRWCLSLASYNAGLGTILAAQRAVGGALLYRGIVNKMPLETQYYVGKILDYWCDDVLSGEYTDE